MQSMHSQSVKLWFFPEDRTRVSSPVPVSLGLYLTDPPQVSVHSSSE